MEQDVVEGFVKKIPTESTVVINDPVHGHIELDPLYMKIIDTPQFQRLRFLKQLGSTCFVFPGAVHTRFEHSIGVCYLAETLCKTLKERQPDLEITDNDVKCVAIAGLCHDLGHGPFCHLFDGKFMSKFEKSKDWKHEKGSVDMFDYLIKVNKLEKFFDPEDLVFIKEQIHPPIHGEYKGREQSKRFLYEIVANKRNGIDVDKWDYIARDCHFLGVKTAFDHNRLMKFVRVLGVDDDRQICTRAKEIDSLYELFHSRMCLHRQAYSHKTCLVIDHMICKALIEANDYLRIEGIDGQKYKMSETIYDMCAFTKLTDNIFHEILYSDDHNLESARKWLERIICRKLPKVIGTFQCDERNKWDEVEILNKLMSHVESSIINRDRFILIKRRFNYGRGDANPIDECCFYNKHNILEPYKVRKDQVSSFLPSKFEETQFILFFDDVDGNLDACRTCYENVCRTSGNDQSMGVEHSGIKITPLKKDKRIEPTTEKLRKNLSIQFSK